MKRSDFDDVLIFRAVQKHLGIRLEAARVTVRAEIADAEIARQLDYAEGAPILAMDMLYRSADQQRSNSRWLVIAPMSSTSSTTRPTTSPDWRRRMDAGAKKL